MTYYDNPILIKEILSFWTDFILKILEEVLAEVSPDYAVIWEDMAYKNGSLISPKIFKEFMAPCYQRVTSFLKERGIDIIFVDSDGDVRQLIPLLLEGGVTGLFPFEVNAGMDIRQMRKEYPALQIIGGLDKMPLIKGDRNLIKEEIFGKVPPLLCSEAIFQALTTVSRPMPLWRLIVITLTFLKKSLELKAEKAR